MIPDTRIAPANSQLYQLLLRTTGISNRRPDAPREVKFVGGAIRWKAPADVTPVTHYCIRIDQDGGVPDMVVPVGTQWMPVPQGTKAWVSAFNYINRLESAKIAVDLSNGSSVTSLSVELPTGVGPNTVDLPAGTTNALLVVEIMNNAAGDGTIEWGTNVRPDTPAKISETASSLNRFLFWWRTEDSEWAILSQWLEFEA